MVLLSQFCFSNDQFVSQALDFIRNPTIHLMVTFKMEINTIWTSSANDSNNGWRITP